jgi:Phage-related baseplate assembly protein
MTTDSGFTAVDLSRLPAPSVIETVSFEQILEEMLADLIARDPSFSALVESDPVYAVLQVAAYREMLLRQRVNDAGRAVMLAYARDGDLDNLGALLGVTRLLISPAVPEKAIAAVYELDDDYRRRITLAPEGFSVAGPEGAYIYHALSADPDVLDASASSPTPGQVVVTVLSRTGDGTAPQALLDKVLAAVSADDRRPLTDEVTAQSADIAEFAVEATIYYYAGPDSSVVLANARASLDAYLASCHRLGLDVTISGLYGAMHVAGVQRVELASPTAALVVDRTQATYCTGVVIHDGGLAE